MEGCRGPDRHIAGLRCASSRAHHDVGGLPAWMSMKLVDPLRELFKEKIRKVDKAPGTARCLTPHFLDVIAVKCSVLLWPVGRSGWIFNSAFAGERLCTTRRFVGLARRVYLQ